MKIITKLMIKEMESICQARAYLIQQQMLITKEW